MEIINDSKDYIEGGLQTQGSAVRNVVRSTDIVGGVFRSQGVMNIGNKLVRIDNKEPKLVINNGTQDNILIGKRTDGTYGFDIAKAGYDVNGASNSNLFYSDRFIKVSYKFSQPGGNVFVGLNTVAADGWVQYVDDSVNSIINNGVQSIDFYKETNLTIESVDIQTVWYDGYRADLTTRTRPTACTLGLNSTFSRVVKYSTLIQRLGGGTLLATITPNADGYINTTSLSTAQMANISNGWNRISLQMDSAASSWDLNWGAVALDVSIKGYLT